MRIRLKALAPLLGLVGSYLASPAALALVPARYAWILAILSGLIAVVTPALVTNRPRTPKKIAPKKGHPTAAKRQLGEPFLPVRDDVAVIGDGSGVELAPMDPSHYAADAEPIPPLGKIPAKEKGDA